MLVRSQSGVWLISIHIHGHIVTKLQLYVLRQGHRRPPIISFEVNTFLPVS